MQLSYAKSWFRAKLRLTDPLSVSEALEIHKTKGAYVVASEKNEKLEWYAEFGNNYVGVGFYNSLLQEYLSYSFQEVDAGKLFLTMSTYRVFDKVTGQVTQGTTFFFNKMGRIAIEREDLTIGTKTASDSIGDVSLNWEPFPTFGEYESLTRIERVKLK